MGKQGVRYGGIGKVNCMAMCSEKKVSGAGFLPRNGLGRRGQTRNHFLVADVTCGNFSKPRAQRIRPMWPGLLHLVGMTGRSREGATSDDQRLTSRTSPLDPPMSTDGGVSNDPE